MKEIRLPVQAAFHGPFSDPPVMIAMEAKRG